MKMYTALYSNDLYTHGDSITEDEYKNLANKSQFEFWFDNSFPDEKEEQLKQCSNEERQKAIDWFDDDDY